MLESAVVVVVLIILGIIMFPKLIIARGGASVASTAESLNLIAQALTHYQAVHGIFPPDSSRVKDTDLMKHYFKGFHPFEIRTPIGGVFDYEGHSSARSVSILIVDDLENKFDHGQALELDDYMDDGNLKSGRFRLKNGRLQYYFASKSSKVKAKTKSSP